MGNLGTQGGQRGQRCLESEKEEIKGGSVPNSPLRGEGEKKRKEDTHKASVNISDNKKREERLPGGTLLRRKISTYKGARR